ncbi:MAG: hypothetical protein F6K23_33885 [Okeania sp. SIO2C9]|uniref:hypothetical protein n=1 Tax=Okeania sp. SIO2C9 TaxID=2607791 RepID=UPI0013C23835|nr:hypothetical protein [Okeania sp. SIO2C9]NEQ77570.1 hypothetical protein [Okeania sp. SIO2C9]
MGEYFNDILNRKRSEFLPVIGVDGYDYISEILVKYQLKITFFITLSQFIYFSEMSNMKNVNVELVVKKKEIQQSLLLILLLLQLSLKSTQLLILLKLYTLDEKFLLEDEDVVVCELKIF